MGLAELDESLGQRNFPAVVRKATGQRFQDFQRNLRPASLMKHIGELQTHPGIKGRCCPDVRNKR